MAKYANRTCYNCGIRKPQPEMRRKDIYVESGRSRPGMSKSTLMASMFGGEDAYKQSVKVARNVGQRTYQRKKTVWTCSGCYRKVRNELGFWEFFRKLQAIIGYTAIGFIILFIIINQ